MSDTPFGPATRVADVEVDGRRIVYVYTPPNWLQEGPGSGPFGEDDEIPGETTDGEPMCIDVSAMSDEDKLKTLIRFAAAVELEKIKAQPNQNREYGVFFYIENNQVRSTQILQTATHRANLDWQGLPRDSNGAIDWTRVVGFMHSHPCINLDEYDTTEVPYGDSSDPFRLMRPSPRRPGPLPPGSSGNPPIIGDWVAWDYYVNEGANPNSLTMIIAGCDGTDLRLNEYRIGDYNYSSNMYNPDGTGGGASDGLSGARNSLDVNPLPPCRA